MTPPTPPIKLQTPFERESNLLDWVSNEKYQLALVNQATSLATVEVIVWAAIHKALPNVVLDETVRGEHMYRQSASADVAAVSNMPKGRIALAEENSMLVKLMNLEKADLGRQPKAYADVRLALEQAWLDVKAVLNMSPPPSNQAKLATMAQLHAIFTPLLKQRVAVETVSFYKTLADAQNWVLKNKSATSNEKAKKLFGPPSTYFTSVVQHLLKVGMPYAYWYAELYWLLWSSREDHTATVKSWIIARHAAEHCGLPRNVVAPPAEPKAPGTAPSAFVHPQIPELRQPPAPVAFPKVQMLKGVNANYTYKHDGREYGIISYEQKIRPPGFEYYEHYDEENSKEDGIRRFDTESSDLPEAVQQHYFDVASPAVLECKNVEGFNADITQEQIESMGLPAHTEFHSNRNKVHDRHVMEVEKQQQAAKQAKLGHDRKIAEFHQQKQDLETQKAAHTFYKPIYDKFHEIPKQMVAQWQNQGDQRLSGLPPNAPKLVNTASTPLKKAAGTSQSPFPQHRGENAHPQAIVPFEGVHQPAQHTAPPVSKTVIPHQKAMPHPRTESPVLEAEFYQTHASQPGTPTDELPHYLRESPSQKPSDTTADRDLLSRFAKLAARGSNASK